MKIRRGFVSNSSSSSFVCSYCNEEVSGWDLCLSEADMFQCKNGHTVCKDHTDVDFLSKECILEFLDGDSFCGVTPKEVEEMSQEELEEWIEEECDLEPELLYSVPAPHCPLCNLEKVERDVMVDYLVKECSVSKAEVFNKIKKENKRRRKLRPYEYFEYVEENASVNVKEMEADVKHRFESFDAFYNYVYS